MTHQPLDRDTSHANPGRSTHPPDARRRAESSHARADSNYYVVKFQNNPQHTRVLVNEWLGTRLAEMIGLPVPVADVVDVHPWLIEHSPELRIELCGRQTMITSGASFGSRYVVPPTEGDVYDYLPETMIGRVRNLPCFAGILAFDKWTCNADGRQAAFWKRRGERKFTASFIDQGYCFNAGEWSFPDAPLRGVFGRNDVYAGITGWESFEPWLSRIENFPESSIWPLVDQILVLVNSSAKQTYADVIVRDLHGNSIAKQRVNFVPFGQSRLDLRTVLNSSATGATTGSILVMQSPDLQGMTIAAQLLLTNTKSETPNYLDEELEMLSADGSQTLRAVADRAVSSPIVAISSVSEKAQHVSVRCLGEGGMTVSHTINLAPAETVVTQACGTAVRHGAEFSTLAMEIKTGSEHPVGIALSSDATPGSFAAFALAPHDASEESYFSSIPFSDPMMAMSPNTVFAGVPVGGTNALPDGTYVPRVTLANFGSRPAHVRIQYASSQPPGASKDNASAQPVELRILRSLPARPVRRFWTAWQAIRICGTLSWCCPTQHRAMSPLSSFLQANLAYTNLNSSAKTKRIRRMAAGTLGPLENGTDSVLLLFNHTNSPQSYNVAIASGAILWQKLLSIAPFQTEAFSFRQLVAGQVKDDKGRTLSPDVTEGSVSWWTPNPEQGRGRLLQVNRNTAMARNFSCGYNIVLCGA